jgi:hypothetical protein
MMQWPAQALVKLCIPQKYQPAVNTNRIRPSCKQVKSLVKRLKALKTGAKSLQIESPKYRYGPRSGLCLQMMTGEAKSRKLAICK